MPGDKYEAVSVDSGYNKYMMLKIRNVKRSDFGSYKCVAKNSLGETDGVIKLDGKLSVILSLSAFLRLWRQTVVLSVPHTFPFTNYVNFHVQWRTHEGPFHFTLKYNIFFVIYMQSNKIHKMILMSKFIQHPC